MNILIIDDDPLVKQVVVDEIKALGHTPVTNDNIDLVILDADLPTDSLDIMKHFRCRVICMSGHSKETPIVKRLIDNGAEYLHKPFTLGELHDYISKGQSQESMDSRPESREA